MFQGQGRVSRENLPRCCSTQTHPLKADLPLLLICINSDRSGCVRSFRHFSPACRFAARCATGRGGPICVSPTPPPRET